MALDQEPLPHPLEARLAASWPPAEWKDVTVLAAISGGGDSVALLSALAALKLPGEGRLVVAHANHKLRGADSDSDQAFVAELCGKLGLACEGVVAPVDVAAGNRGQGVEAAARRARYAVLEEIAGRVGARFVVTAHTADDQAETILHRILRGTGIRGLGGIARARRLGTATLLRPLLGIRREELADYLRDRGQPCRHDASNRDRRFTRNRIRLELLPHLAEQYNSNICDALLRLGELAAESQALVDALVGDLVGRSVRHVGRDEVRLDLDGLAGQPSHLVREALVEVWRRQGWPQAAMGFAEWDCLAEMIAGGLRKRILPGAIEAEISDGELRLLGLGKTD